MRNLKDLSFFASSSIFLNIAGLISGFIVFRWIDPYNIGIWQTLLLFDIYSTFLRIGVINGMNRELPFKLGQGEKEGALEYASVTLFHTISVICFIVIASPFIIQSVSAGWVFPVVTIIVVIVLKFYNSYSIATFRAGNEFNDLSKIQFIQAALRLVSIVFVYFWHFEGFCIREIFVLLVITLITHIKAPIKVKPKFEFKIFTELLKTGLPIFAGSYLFNFFYTLPRLFLLKWGTVEMLGIYAPVFTFLTAVTVLPDSLNSYFYPKMSYQLGKNNDSSALWKKSLYVTLGLFLLGLPVVITGIYSAPVIIDNFLPMYSKTKEIITAGLCIGLFMSFRFSLTTLNTLKAWKHVFAFTFIFGLLQFTIPFIMLRFMSPLNAVVYGQLLSSAVMCVISLLIVYHAIKYSASLNVQPKI